MPFNQIGLNAPLKKFTAWALSLEIFGIPFLDLTICAVIKEYVLVRRGLALKIMKFEIM